MVRNRSMRKKHGTVRIVIRPSVLWTVTGSDGFDSFSLKRRRPDSFFFFSLNGVVLKQLQHFFSPPIRRRSASLKITLLKPSFLISQSLSTLTCLCLSQILTLSSLNLSLAPSYRRSSASLPRAVALRTLQLSLFVTLSSHFAAQPLSRVAVAA